MKTSEIVNNVLKQMGVDPTKTPHWMVNKHKAIDQATGKVFKEYDSGYLCSYCGKQSWTKKAKCDGCNSIMQEDVE